MKLIPIISVLIIKAIINIVASKIVFLNRKSKIMALDNFRAFNVFLYFNFFYYCFLGWISAIIRLIKSVILAVLMMPSKIITFLLILNS